MGVIVLIASLIGVSAIILILILIGLILALVLNTIIMLFHHEKKINAKKLKFWTIIFSIIAAILFLIMLYLKMRWPINESGCGTEGLPLSPDKHYKAVICDASYKILHNDMKSINIYEIRTGKLVFKGVDDFEANSFDWTCGGHPCAMTHCYGVAYGNMYGGTGCVSTWWNRFRAKIPLW